MPDSLPKFDRPPVVETAISSQFARLASFRIAHAGAYWQRYIPDWKDIQEVGRIPDAVEKFGNERQWGQMGIRLFSSPEVRTQISSPDGTRMIQLQDSRFVYNWKKGKGEYPSFDKTIAESATHYSEFRKFIGDAGLGQIEENQWEATYINHLIKGELWESSDDWNRIFPWLRFPSAKYSKPDYLVCEWSSIIGENLGRLHINLTFGRTAMDGPEALILTLTARGGIDKQSNLTLENGLNLAHKTIVLSFTEMTSEWAHDKWERKQ